VKTVKINFTVPEDIAEALKTRIGKRKRSAFVAAAVRDRLKQIEIDNLRQSLVEGYQARCTEDSQINGEWTEATLENWS
jgi:hypothetical protein